MTRIGVWMTAAFSLALVAEPASAGLQNVRVGGQITILGEYYRNADTPGDGLRWPAPWLPARPIGTGIGAGEGIFSWLGADGHGPGSAFVTQWTRLHVDAGFTDDVRAFIEFDSVDEWGEDFRSDYLTGVDARAGTGDDVEVYQAYIEANALFGHPLRLRIGRQEMGFGSEWLVGPNTDGPAPIWGLSFDALRLTYATDLLSVDAWWSKALERGSAEEDGDADFFGVYASYTGLEDITIDAYWMWLRDAMGLKDTSWDLLSEWMEDVLAVDDYGVTNIHTVGLRAAGAVGAFDFEAEAAYQWGEAGAVGFWFRPVFYGDDDADYGEWALNLEAGYSFDLAWQPRLYLGYTYFGGEDERGISFGQWLWSFVNPFYAPGASVSFNRLFSNWRYSNLLGGSELSNVHVFRGGVEATPTDRLELSLTVSYLVADEAFDAPAHLDFGKVLGNYRLRVPILPGLSFWTNRNDDELGWETELATSYQYSEDLYFAAGWSHLFVGDGLDDGHFLNAYGLDFTGGSDDDDADYWYFEAGICF